MLGWISFWLVVSIAADEQLYFGVLNHRPRWHFHCPNNVTKISDPPTNEQPLISYQCAYPSLPMEILPVEIDLTFLCRLQSRLIWIIVDLYQYNTFSWLIHSKEIDIRVQLNRRISLTDVKSEMTNYTYRLILINAFYLPFESIESLADQAIEISIVIQHVNQLNRCEFLIREDSPWQTFLDEQCLANRSKTLSVEYARCHFYSNRSKSIETHPPVGNQDFLPTTTEVEPTFPDLNIILSVNEEPPLTTTSTSRPNTTISSITHFAPYPNHHHYLFLEENIRLLSAALARSSINPTLLKSILIFLVLILLILIIFFLYVLCYHYSIRSQPSYSLEKTSLSL